MEKDRVPQTLAEAEEPYLWRDMQHWLERRKRKKILHEQIENLLNRDAAVHVVSQSLYNGRRRNVAPSCQDASLTTPILATLIRAKTLTIQMESRLACSWVGEDLSLRLLAWSTLL